MGKEVIKTLYFIYSIFVFGQVSKIEYIRYSYLVRYIGTNLFDICIHQVARHEYTQYSYSVGCLDMNIFDMPNFSFLSQLEH